MYKNKKIVATIEARMTSSRLPGKVLLPLAGKPALERMIERLKRSKYLDKIMVATTINFTDDPIVELAKKLKVGYFRGSEYDVLARVLEAAESVKADIIVELTGDCPLVDPVLVDKGIEEFFDSGADYAANNISASYPLGFDIQVFPVSVLKEVDSLTNDKIDRAHVSYYIYNHPKRFKLHNWVASRECYWPDLRVTLDEKEDYELLNTVFNKLLLINENFSVSDVINLCKNEPKLVEINKNVKQKEAWEG